MYIKKKSQKQEKRTAKEFGGKVTPASGAIDMLKGDVRTGTRCNGEIFNNEDFLIENKFTDKDYYKLDLKTWQKIVREAIKDNLRIPLMQIDIQELQIVAISANDLKGIGINISSRGTYYEISNKSFRLKKDVLINLFNEVQQVNIMFQIKTSIIDVVLMKKDLFLSLLGK